MLNQFKINKFKSKKSQVTIFIVIGVILVIVMAFLISSNTDLLVSRDTKIKNQISDIVKSCIDDSGRRGAFLLGFQGGVIEISDQIKANPNYYTDFGYKIPNWDSERIGIPTINSMTKELTNFVKSNALTCINSNLKSLEDHYKINNSNELDLNVEINDENIILLGNLPIIFNEINSDEIFRVDDFYVKLDGIRLGSLFKLATDIITKERSTHFYEELVLDQIYSASDYSDRKHSMPSEGMSLSCVPQVWTINQLKQTLAALNNNNFNYLYFEGTYPIKDKLEKLDKNYQKYYNAHYNIKLNNNDNTYKNFQVNTIMPSSDISGSKNYFQRYPYRTFKVSPNSGEIVKPTKMKVDISGGKMPIPCVQIYHHVYDLDYDLIIKIVDKNEDGSNFFFQFPMRIMIKNNNPKILGDTTVPTPKINQRQKDYCETKNLKYPLQVYAKDTKTDEFISGVNLSYTCINANCKNIGVTKKPMYRQGIIRQDSIPYSKENYPFCIGGLIKGEKEGYHFGTLRVDTTKDNLLNTQGTYDINMIPTLKYKIDKSTFLMINKETKQGTRVYSKSDGYVLLSIENKDLQFNSFVTYPNEGYFDTLTLLDDDSINYTATAMFIDANQNLRGILEYDNWKPDLSGGNELQITIPSSISSIDENFLDFYNYMNSVKNDNPYGIKLI